MSPRAIGYLIAAMGEAPARAATVLLGAGMSLSDDLARKLSRGAYHTVRREAKAQRRYLCACRAEALVARHKRRRRIIRDALAGLSVASFCRYMDAVVPGWRTVAP